MQAIETLFKNMPVMQLPSSTDDKFPFTFGLKKARLILENVDAIKKFVESHADDKPVEKKAKTVKAAKAEEPLAVL